ncbi:DUF1876 domain-containing protein [Streptomyces sp. NBC_00009]|uniref:DUF1876 domain-containing protein n=1 Tax=Streptomyces sp. NBC_00009 TaxID=2975620 RepID=UPI00324EAA9B
MQTHLSWHLDLSIDDSGSETGAVAQLRLPDATEMSARGHSKRHPDDPVQTLVGEELATARALNDLAHQLLRKAAHEIEEKTHAPAHPHL